MKTLVSVIRNYTEKYVVFEFGPRLINLLLTRDVFFDLFGPPKICFACIPLSRLIIFEYESQYQ